MSGNIGKVLNVDLYYGLLKEEKPSQEEYNNYLGGYGLAAHRLFKEIPPKAEPLGPKNILAFTTGPLVGTPAITGCRFTVSAKSPLTGTWGDSNCGGFFGPALKQAGYDAIFVKGCADKPIYLYINEGKAELKDAGFLWGLDATETENMLKEKHGKDCQVATIGQAGENLSFISGVMHDGGRAAGRSGLGAVMGSKKLKAVVVRGKLSVPMTNEEEAKKLRQINLEQIKENPKFQLFQKYGSIDHVASSCFSNDSPVKNWAAVGIDEFPNATKISDDAILVYETKKYACWHCPIACGGIYSVKDGKFAVEEAHKPEYETCGMFGNNLLIDDIEAIIKLNDMCNRFGFDTISAAGTIAYAIECYEKGYLTKEETNGLELRWGDAEVVVKLLEMMAKREGIGDLLADGSLKAMHKIGKETEEFAVQVQGQELPAHDPKFGPSWGTYYKVDATPGRHTQIGLVMYEIGAGVPGLTLPEPIERYRYKNKGTYAAKVQNILHAVYSTGVCLFAVQRVNVYAWPEFLNAVTGENYSIDEFEKIGARIATLRQAFNVREGLDVANFKMPGRAYGNPPLTGGPLKDITIDLDTMAKEYYGGQQWDKSGKPTTERLKKLGLDFVVM
ncbi:MAG: hypothetical protein VR72_17680 [Clostridiaceae bacterium BRH_c20a]|nr:MAG: hypothetical protein VR72_17680 [Clostridiaceae bacterium BRH_c20a]